MLTTEFNAETERRVLYSDGKIEGFFETAKNMLQDGVDFLTVSKYTDLDRDTVQRLADSR
ncbi:hypothetical protein FACS1894133_5680 [Clostridia bacterium]|nr:hypothetical protein FACS1894133_5680 [Clostridia bacterium]